MHNLVYAWVYYYGCRYVSQRILNWLDISSWDIFHLQQSTSASSLRPTPLDCVVMCIVKVTWFDLNMYNATRFFSNFFSSSLVRKDFCRKLLEEIWRPTVYSTMLNGIHYVGTMSYGLTAGWRMVNIMTRHSTGHPGIHMRPVFERTELY